MNLREWAAIPRGGVDILVSQEHQAVSRMATFEESLEGWERFFIDAPINPPGIPRTNSSDGFYLEFTCGEEKFFIRQTGAVGDAIQIGLLEMRSEFSSRWFEILDRHHIHSVFELIRLELQGFLDKTE